MNTVDLLREWRSTAAPSRAEVAALGIAPRDATLLIGIAPIRLCRGDLFEPDPDGRACLITPVCVHTELNPESSAPNLHCRIGAIVDLVAWHPQQPERRASRAGIAEWLGCIEPQYLDPDPVPIRRSVLSWFQAGCTGLVLLSPSALDQYRTLMGCAGGIIAEDADHRAELRRALQRPFRTPRITIAEPEYRGDVAA